MKSKKSKMSPSFRVIDGKLKVLKGKSWVLANDVDKKVLTSVSFNQAVNEAKSNVDEQEIDLFPKSGNSKLLRSLSDNLMTSFNTLSFMCQDLEEQAALVPNIDVQNQAKELKERSSELTSFIKEGIPNLDSAFEYFSGYNRMLCAYHDMRYQIKL